MRRRRRDFKSLQRRSHFLVINFEDAALAHSFDVPDNNEAGSGEVKVGICGGGGRFTRFQLSRTR